MKPFVKPPAVAEIFPFFGGAFLITQVDLEKMEGMFKLFRTVEEALLFKHDASLKSYPRWHSESCHYCKTGEWG